MLLNGQKLLGRPMKVELAQQKKPTAARGAPSRTLFVGRIPQDADENEIGAMAQKYGAVQAIRWSSKPDLAGYDPPFSLCSSACWLFSPGTALASCSSTPIILFGHLLPSFVSSLLAPSCGIVSLSLFHRPCERTLLRRLYTAFVDFADVATCTKALEGLRKSMITLKGKRLIFDFGKEHTPLVAPGTHAAPNGAATPQQDSAEQLSRQQEHNEQSKPKKQKVSDGEEKSVTAKEKAESNDDSAKEEKEKESDSDSSSESKESSDNTDSSEDEEKKEEKEEEEMTDNSSSESSDEDESKSESKDESSSESEE